MAHFDVEGALGDVHNIISLVEQYMEAEPKTDAGGYLETARQQLDDLRREMLHSQAVGFCSVCGKPMMHNDEAWVIIQGYMEQGVGFEDRVMNRERSGWGDVMCPDCKHKVNIFLGEEAAESEQEDQQ